MASDSKRGGSGNSFGIRHVQILLLFFLLFVTNTMRSNMSVAIVAMRDPSANLESNSPTYVWDDASTVLSSYFWGYVWTQIPMGLLANKYGPKWILTGAMALGASVCFLIPFAAHLGSWAVMACQIGQGLLQGGFYPINHNLLSKWVPPSERARLSSFTFVGGVLGIVAGMSITGWICASKMGWPFSFYFFGTLGLLWSVFWAIFGSNSPQEHSSISFEEKHHIMGSLLNFDNEKNTTIPLGAILKSLPFWAILISHCVTLWGYFTMLTGIPTYLNKVLHFDIMENGLLSACPYLLLLAVSTITSFLTDYVINKKLTSLLTTRKIVNSIGLYIPAAVLTVLAFFVKNQEDSLLAVVLLNLGVGLIGSAFCGYAINHMDISPNHAGSLMGFTNTAANLSSIVGTLLVRFVVVDEANANQWKTIFLVSAGLYVVGNTIFLLFGRGTVQEWNSTRKETTSIEMIETQI